MWCIIMSCDKMTLCPSCMFVYRLFIWRKWRFGVIAIGCFEISLFIVRFEQFDIAVNQQSVKAFLPLPHLLVFQKEILQIWNGNVCVRVLRRLIRILPFVQLWSRSLYWLSHQTFSASCVCGYQVCSDGSVQPMCVKRTYGCHLAWDCLSWWSD